MSDFLVSGAAPGESRVAVIALGGNALLRRGEPPKLEYASARKRKRAGAPA